MQLIAVFLKNHPEAAIFLFQIGVGGFSLDNATAVLIVATVKTPPVWAGKA